MGEESNIVSLKIEENLPEKREKRLKEQRQMIKIRKGKAYLAPTKIIYITTDDRQLKFVLLDKKPFTSKSRLSAITEQLDYPYLYRTRSHLVNLEHIQQIISKNKSYRSSKNYQKILVMDNQDSLNISDPHAAKITEIFEQE